MMDDSGQPQESSKHLDRMLSAESVKVINDIHEKPHLSGKLQMGQIRWPKLGNLSYLKPMIDENKHTVIERLKIDPRTKRMNTSDWASERNPIKLNNFQLELYSLLRLHQDLLYTNETLDNVDEVQKVYVLHILNHLFNSRCRIISNNKIFEKKTMSDNFLNDDSILRDQGFTRARILILLPFRYTALKVAKDIANMSGPDHTIINMDRFIDEFGDTAEYDTNLRHSVAEASKPNEFNLLFHGNTDDAFRVGVKLTKKCVKFFTDFYDSDIIIASPLGLKTILSPDEHHAASARDSEQVPATGDRDFLSSIEIVIMDMADVFLMQNWEHVLDIMEHVNHMPKKPRNVDISRVRQWHLEDWSKYYRQMVMFTSISVPLVHSFFQKHSFNYEGYFTFRHRVDKPAAEEVKNKCKQQFLFYDSKSAKEACDARFQYFIKEVLPRFSGVGAVKDKDNDKDKDIDEDDDMECDQFIPDEPGHTLIFISSYFDYVRLRNYFRREKLSFTQICEYTEENKVAKARQLFYFGARHFLLYTERCHFYHRYRIKGIRNIIFYEAPIYGKFYTEIVKMLIPKLQGKKFDESKGQFSVTTLFSNHDTLILGAIIGYSNAVKLIQNKNSLL